MRCPKCGKEVVDGHRFCGWCAALLVAPPLYPARDSEAESDKLLAEIVGVKPRGLRPLQGSASEDFPRGTVSQTETRYRRPLALITVFVILCFVYIALNKPTEPKALPATQFTTKPDIVLRVPQAAVESAAPITTIPTISYPNSPPVSYPTISVPVFTPPEIPRPPIVRYDYQIPPPYQPMPMPAYVPPPPPPPAPLVFTPIPAPVFTRRVDGEPTQTKQEVMDVIQSLEQQPKR